MKKQQIYGIATNNFLQLSIGMLFAKIKSTVLDSIYNLTYVETFMIPYILKNKSKEGFGIYLFTNYVWNEKENLKYAKQIKENSATNIIIFGGPNAPSYEKDSKDFIFTNNFIDLVIYGEGEETIVNVLNIISKEKSNYKKKLFDVKGIYFKDENNDFIFNGPAPRIVDLNSLPSPYLTGVFDKLNFKHLAIFYSNRGCPYGCAYCDWGSSTLQKVRHFDLDRVLAEIEWYGKNKVEWLFFSDANFGMFKRDIEIAKKIAEVKLKYGYPKELTVCYSKTASKRLLEICDIFLSVNLTSYINLAPETFDDKTLKIISRNNIKQDDYFKLIDEFKERNIPIICDVMLGLPGATLESFKNDLDILISNNLNMMMFSVQVLRNSPMNDPIYKEKYKIEIDDKGFIISTFSYSNDDYKLMKKMSKIYFLSFKFSFFRYIFYYLQWDYNIKAVNIIYDLALHLDSLPYLKVFLEYTDIKMRQKLYEINQEKKDLLYEEISNFLKNKYELEDNKFFTIINNINSKLMPNIKQTYPITIDLDYDVLSYFSENSSKKENFIKLKNYNNKITLVIEDKEGISKNYQEKKQNSDLQIFWELDSKLKIDQSASTFRKITKKQNNQD